MITTLILFAVALAAAGILLLVVRGRSTALARFDDARGETLPVDLDAFRNLTDPAEEEFLRVSLPASEFRRIQRLRIRAALEYVDRAGHNAAILLRVGEAARLSQDPEIARAGSELANAAVRLRLYVLMVSAKLWLGLLLPDRRLSPAELAGRYQRLTGFASALGQLQRPAKPMRAAL